MHLAGGGLGFPLAAPQLYRSHFRPALLPRSHPDEGAALQNRSYIYDCALAIIAFAASGNFVAAARIIEQLDEILDNPGYLAAIIFENGEDGQSATRWTKSNPADSVTDITDPTQPPYGDGLVVDFHARAANDTFTYCGSGLPDTTDTQVQFEHKEAKASRSISPSASPRRRGKVTSVQVTSGARGGSRPQRNRDHHRRGTRQRPLPLRIGGRGRTGLDARR